MLPMRNSSLPTIVTCTIRTRTWARFGKEKGKLLGISLRSMSSGSTSDRAKPKVNVLKALEGENKAGKVEPSGEFLVKAKLWLEEGRSLAASKLHTAREWIAETGGSGGFAPKNPGGEEWYYKRVSFWMKRYENFVGLTEVKAAQAKVVETEKAFVDSQDLRRDAQSRIREVQDRVKEIHADLQKTHRGEDFYLTLVTQEHQILKEEHRLLAEFQAHEKKERECFSLLSAAVRDSHEKERAQAEKTKYWSVLGSIIGTCLGILGTTINNRLRMRELRDLVSRSASGEKLTEVTEKLGQELVGHEDRLKDLVNQVQEVIRESKANLAPFAELRVVSDTMKEASRKFDIQNLESKALRLSVRTEALHLALDQQMKSLQVLSKDLKKMVSSQATTIMEAVGSQQSASTQLLKESGERDAIIRSGLESLYNNQESIHEYLVRTNGATQKTVHELQRLLKNIQTMAASRREKEALLVEGLDASLVDKIEAALEDQGTRAAGAALTSGLLVALAVLALNKFLG